MSAVPRRVIHSGDVPHDQPEPVQMVTMKTNKSSSSVAKPKITLQQVR